MTKITSQEFDNLARFIVQAAGIQLDKGKEYLMEARLEPVMERYGLDTFSDLYQQTIADTTGKLKASIIDAITINETYFFRDATPFELLKHKIIPDLIDQKTTESGQRRIPLRFWSAACSTGQEVYSIGMSLKEMFLDSERFEISILGTDISNDVLARASYGKYNQFEIERGLSSYFLTKYFTKQGNAWRINDEIRSLARFTQADLNQSLSSLGKFDVIFCRNVAIYFPLEGKIKLFQKLAGALNPSGVLIVGGSESLAGLANDFVPRHYLKGVFYQLIKSEANRGQPPELSPYRQQSGGATPHRPSIPVSHLRPEPANAPSRVPLRSELRSAEIKKTQAPSPVPNQLSQKEELVKTTPPESASDAARSPISSEPGIVDDLGKESLLLKLRTKATTQGSPLLHDPKQTQAKPSSLLEKLKAREKEKENEQP